MKSSKPAWLAALLAVGLTLIVGLAACGDDDGTENGDSEPAAQLDTDAAEPSAGETPDDDSDVPSSGIEVPPAKEAKGCLEKEGFTVSSERSTQKELSDQLGITDQLTLVGDGGGVPGAGSVIYYETLEQAEAGRKTENELIEPGTVLGRRENVVYVYSSEDLQGATKAILGCL